MENWKVILDHQGKKIYLDIVAKTYSEAYLNAAMEYPEGRILSIKTLEETNKDSKKKNK